MKNKGFTLIELLAVITIMGILMLVAIPAVSRTIENSRRDTFADNAKTYIETVRNAALADELSCTVDGKNITYSATPDGWYYYKICTKDETGCQETNTSDLMEKVSKSSWGSAELYGVVIWNKHNQKTDYYGLFVDSAKHGMTEPAPELDIKRGLIKTSGAVDKAKVFTDYKFYVTVTNNNTTTKYFTKPANNPPAATNITSLECKLG